MQLTNDVSNIPKGSLLNSLSTSGHTTVNCKFVQYVYVVCIGRL